jgi:hypothetical protein
VKEISEVSENTIHSDEFSIAAEMIAPDDVAVQKTHDDSAVYEVVRRRHSGALPT